MLVAFALLGVAAQAQVLDRVEIEGPVSIPEGGQASYRCWAYFTDGQRLDVTQSATWEVDQPQFGRFVQPGRFEAFQVNQDVLVTLCATFSLGGRTRSDDYLVQIENGSLLWNNGFNTGTGQGTPLSPPSFPNRRAADDIVVPSSGWLIEGMMYLVNADAGWQDGGTTEVFLYTDAATLPGTRLFSLFTGHLRLATGATYNGKPEYRYFTTGLKFALPEGRYWIGVRHPNATGGGTAYWEANLGAVEHPFAVSFNEGRTWQRGPTGLDPVFQLRGTPLTVATLESFAVTRGFHVSGGLPALTNSDDAHLIIGTVKQTSLSTPVAQLEVQASVGNSPVGHVVAVVEASVLLPPMLQRVEMFNFLQNRWVVVDERLAATNDSRTPVIAPGRGEEYVHPLLRSVRLRVGFVDLGLSVATVHTRVDQVHISFG